MILTGPEIRKQIQKGAIRIDPFDDALIGPNSVDLHLGDSLWVYRLASTVSPLSGRTVYHPIDSKAPPPIEELPTLPQGGWLLLPGCLYLGSTLEFTETWGFVPYLDGRSSLGRLGVFAHITAGRGDNGFCGRWTVELAVVQPVILYPRERYFQMTFHTVIGDSAFYTGRYQGDSAPVASRIHEQYSPPEFGHPALVERIKKLLKEEGKP